MTKQETLNHKDHGATLKHKCGKKDSNIAPSLLSLIFLGLLFFWPLSFFGPSPFLFGLSIFPHMGQYSNNEDHHTSIYLQLKNYNSILEQNMTLYACLRRCTGMRNEFKSDMYEKL